MATVNVLHTGYTGDRVGGTVVLVRDADATIVVDPGMVAARALSGVEPARRGAAGAQAPLRAGR